MVVGIDKNYIEFFIERTKIIRGGIAVKLGNIFWSLEKKLKISL